MRETSKQRVKKGESKGEKTVIERGDRERQWEAERQREFENSTTKFQYLTKKI